MSTTQCSRTLNNACPNSLFGAPLFMREVTNKYGCFNCISNQTQSSYLSSKQKTLFGYHHCYATYIDLCAEDFTPSRDTVIWIELRNSYRTTRSRQFRILLFADEQKRQRLHLVLVCCGILGTKRGASSSRRSQAKGKGNFLASF